MLIAARARTRANVIGEYTIRRSYGSPDLHVD